MRTLNHRLVALELDRREPDPERHRGYIEQGVAAAAIARAVSRVEAAGDGADPLDRSLLAWVDADQAHGMDALHHLSDRDLRNLAQFLAREFPHSRLAPHA